MFCQTEVQTMKMIGRETEYHRLCDQLKSEESTVALIHGRSGMGLTRLALEVMQHSDVRSVYDVGHMVDEPLLTSSFRHALAASFEDAPQDEHASLHQLFSWLFHKAESEHILLVLDNFHDACKACPGLLPTIQDLHTAFRTDSRLHILLVGQTAFLPQKAFSTADLLIQLQPLTRDDAYRFYPSLPEEDQELLYYHIGSVPFYLSMIDPEKSARENILHLLIEPQAPLAHYIPDYITRYNKQAANLNAVLLAIAHGCSTFKEILVFAHTSTSPTLVDLLKKLTSIGIVEKKVGPLIPGKRQEIAYRFADPLARFYYHYLFPFERERTLMIPSDFMETFVLSETDHSEDPDAIDFPF